jgi:A/G-specific adenine glycosylase
MNNKMFFSNKLLHWYDNAEKRDLPWKKNADPYHIWLSEIMLQQTRVEQGTPYFIKFTATYRNITELANAPEDEILKLWQGLGYYARARNMHFSAKTVRDKYEGIFPSEYEQIRALKGIGDYSAAAIASFAFGLPYAVVDGNVYRVLSRFFGIETPIDSAEGKKIFQQLASELLNKNRPGDYNQAIMDFGATLCKPTNPLCSECPLATNCKALKNKKIDVLPVKGKKMTKRKRFFYYFVWKSPEGKTIIRKRGKGDIWAGLYDFPLIETEKEESFLILQQSDFWKTWVKDTAIEKKSVKFSTTYRQLLTHQNILAIFVEISGKIPAYFFENTDYKSIDIVNLFDFALPKTIQGYLENDLLQL